MSHSYKDNGDTQDICVKLTERKVEQLHSEKGAKRCDSLHNISVTYEIKGNKEVCSFRKNKRTLCDSHTKLSGTVGLEN